MSVLRASGKVVGYQDLKYLPLWPQQHQPGDRLAEFPHDKVRRMRPSEYRTLRTNFGKKAMTHQGIDRQELYQSDEWNILAEPCLHPYYAALINLTKPDVVG